MLSSQHVPFPAQVLQSGPLTAGKKNETEKEHREKSALLCKNIGDSLVTGDSAVLYGTSRKLSADENLTGNSPLLGTKTWSQTPCLMVFFVSFVHRNCQTMAIFMNW